MQLLHTPKKTKIAAIKLLQISCIASPPVIFTGLVGRFWLQPCNPYVPLFDFLDKCSQYANKYYISNMLNSSGKFSMIYWTGYCLLLYYLVMKPSLGCLFALGQTYFVQSCCIQYYLKTIFENVNRRSSFSDRQRLVKLYKQIQLLVCYYNEIHQDIFTNAVLWFVGLCIVIGLYAIITSFSIIAPLQLLVLGSASSQAVIGFVLCFGNFGAIYDESQNILAGFRTRAILSQFSSTQLTEYRFENKVAKSIQPVKIKLGSVNFVDGMMPITFIDFCFGMLVNMLLIK